MGISPGDNPPKRDFSDELKESRQIEKRLEKLDREERNFLIDKLREGEFDEAEEKADEWFSDDEEYYSYIADLAEFLKSRKIHKAKNLQRKSLEHLEEVYEKRHDTERREEHIEKLTKALIDMQNHVKKAPSDIEDSKQIMKEYSHLLHRAERDGDKDAFEYLVEQLSLRREELDELRENYNQLVDLKKKAESGKYRPLMKLFDDKDSFNEPEN